MRDVLSLEQIGVFRPEDLERVQALFDRLCAIQGIDKDSDAAANLALSILSHYTHGIHDADNIEKLLRL